MVQDFAALSKVVAALADLDVSYILGGSMASSAHGIARTTNDFDLSVDLQPEKIAAFVALLGDEFYADEESIREAVSRGGSVNLIHQVTLDKVDLFTANTERERGEHARAVEVELSPSFTVRVASPEDTVIRKLDWYRQGGDVSDRQWNDILGVLKVQGEHFDRVYAVERAAELGLTALLERALEDGGPE